MGKRREHPVLRIGTVEFLETPDAYENDRLRRVYGIVWGAAARQRRLTGNQTTGRLPGPSPSIGGDFDASGDLREGINRTAERG